jgi:hypothetical protein
LIFLKYQAIFANSIIIWISAVEDYIKVVSFLHLNERLLVRHFAAIIHRVSEERYWQMAKNSYKPVIMSNQGTNPYRFD